MQDSLSGKLELSERIIQVTGELEVIDLCEAGRYREAALALEGLNPDRHPLAFGIVETSNGRQERAKDYLSRAIRQGSEKAKLHLACAYWRSGEIKEANAILDELPDSFEVLLLRACIVSELNPGAALEILARAANYPVAPGLQARLHNQRAIVLRRLGETDRAIREYDAALHYFAEAKSDCVPLVINNLVSVYLDCEDYGRAHSQIDRAIGMLARESDHLAKAYDQKARIFLAENRLDDAERYARLAVRSVESSDRRAWLAECLLTHAATLIRKGELRKALIQSERAEEIGRYLNSDQIILDACPIKKAIGKALARDAEIKRIKSALRIAGNVRGAAKHLGVSHVALVRGMKRHGIEQ